MKSRSSTTELIENEPSLAYYNFCNVASFLRVYFIKYRKMYNKRLLNPGQGLKTIYYASDGQFLYYESNFFSKFTYLKVF